MDKGDILKISESVVASIVTTAALEVEGVCKVHQRLNPDVKSLVGSKKPPVKGIDVKKTEGGIDITLQISIYNGHKIPDITKKVQKNVFTAVQNMTGTTVSKVNVVVDEICERSASQKKESAEQSEE